MTLSQLCVFPTSVSLQYTAVCECIIQAAVSFVFCYLLGRWVSSEPQSCCKCITAEFLSFAAAERPRPDATVLRSERSVAQHKVPPLLFSAPQSTPRLVHLGQRELEWSAATSRVMLPTFIRKNNGRKVSKKKRTWST